MSNDETMPQTITTFTTARLLAEAIRPQCLAFGVDWIAETEVMASQLTREKERKTAATGGMPLRRSAAALPC